MGEKKLKKKLQIILITSLIFAIIIFLIFSYFIAKKYAVETPASIKIPQSEITDSESFDGIIVISLVCVCFGGAFIILLTNYFKK